MAYRKGDIPKVKLDIPNAPKFDLGDLTEPMSNMDRLFDNIAKDIRERQDNAMAMEFTKCIGELLKKNGVIPKITEYTHENVKKHSIEQLYGVSIDELDFSEHDKVFEDEIAKLEKKNKDLERCFIQREQDSTDTIMKLKQEKSDKNEKIAELACENESLKQRIAELESKNESLNQSINEITTSRSEWIDKAVEWQQKCEKLESKETEICEKEPKVSGSALSIEWYENRHQSDCIEINRLNTTIDVLIHKVEYLRQFAGLE